MRSGYKSLHKSATFEENLTRFSGQLTFPVGTICPDKSRLQSIEKRTPSDPRRPDFRAQRNSAAANRKKKRVPDRSNNVPCRLDLMYEQPFRLNPKRKGFASIWHTTRPDPSTCSFNSTRFSKVLLSKRDRHLRRFRPFKLHRRVGEDDWLFDVRVPPLFGHVLEKARFHARAIPRK